MKRVTVGVTTYRLIFGECDEIEVQSAALIEVLGQTGGYKPRTVWVLDNIWRRVDKESIDACWAKVSIGRV